MHVPGQADPVWKRSLRINLGRPRMIPNGIHVHQSVSYRLAGVSGYKPKNLPPQYLKAPQSECELVTRPVHGELPVAPAKRPLLRRPSMVGLLAMLTVIAICGCDRALLTTQPPGGAQSRTTEGGRMACSELDGRSASSVLPHATRKRTRPLCMVSRAGAAAIHD